jgi:hypothetical protein
VYVPLFSLARLISPWTSLRPLPLPTSHHTTTTTQVNSQNSRSEEAHQAKVVASSDFVDARAINHYARLSLHDTYQPPSQEPSHRKEKWVSASWHHGSLRTSLRGSADFTTRLRRMTKVKVKSTPHPFSHPTPTSAPASPLSTVQAKLRWRRGTLR